MKIFEFHYTKIDEYDWVLASDVFEAMKLLGEEHPQDFAEMDEGITIRPLTDEEWDKKTIVSNEPELDGFEETSFREYVKDNNTSMYIAGTMNDY